MDALLDSNLLEDERELIGLLYSCPLGTPLYSCVLNQMRKVIKPDFQKSIESFVKENIPKLLSEHEKCLYQRVKNKELKHISKSDYIYHKEIAYLMWTNKGNLSYLLIELKKRKWINSPRDFVKLFNNKDINLRVYWEMQYKYELAYLLFKLIEGDFIRPINSKGYFKIAEQHIIDYSKNIFTNNSLKQISSKISLEPDKHVGVIRNVENVIKAISCKKNRLLKDYSK